jgi:hypothetical protein
VQMQALRHNDKPYADHGIEVLYRYSNLVDPFQRSCYFGCARAAACCAPPPMRAHVVRP